ncbi:hypothetical protein ES703_10786 [subsurface metagenome]
MPPRNVKSIRDLIYWEYAKLIAGRAVGDRKNYRFVMHMFQCLKKGKITPSLILKENKMLVEGECCCAYCGSKESLQWEHIIPKSRGGPDNIDNMVQSCKECNCKKGSKGPFEWYGLERRYEIPRIVLGKYLKLVFDEHERVGALDSEDLNAGGKLNVYDFSAVFKR